MADRIVIMDSGVVAQVGTPREVYENPATVFVAGFIGSPAMNFFSVRRTDGGRWAAEASTISLPPLPQFEASTDRLILGIRPEHLEVRESDTAVGDAWTFEADVVLAELLGADALLNLSVGGEEMLARVGGTDHPRQGARVRVRLVPERLHAFEPSTGEALKRRAFATGATAAAPPGHAG